MGTYVGQQFGNYRLIKLLGEGGFAEVYLGQHIHLGTFAAIKVLTTKLAEDAIEKFQNEARTMMGLAHPNIVRILDFGLADRIPFIIMNYAHNGSLRQKYSAGTFLPLPTAIQYVQQIASALQYIHDRKLIHRDVKPDNMLLGHQNEVWLSDFGIAAVAHSTRSLKVQDGSGTVNYMSPEQIQGQPRTASDQYSLAVVVYEWLCGKRPFNGTPYEIATQHLVIPPTSLRLQISTIPIEIEQVVMKALSKDSKQRFVTVQQFADELMHAYHTYFDVDRGAIAKHPKVLAASQLINEKGGSIADQPMFPRYQAQKKRLGFIVGTRSDPGIKRKYKPNEDSLLVAQGVIDSTSGPQAFGLFVIADGMGRHASGQDASRLAIQKITDYILPKLVMNRTGLNEYARILVDSIQSANQAVHQRNIDIGIGGDMGTTVTTALVVGAVAYVANVGDSRTYLYRKAVGMQKVTNDHSVVAKLIESKQITQEEVYTHPQRKRLYRSLGAKNIEVDTFMVQLREDDKLLLCSDGLWDMVPDPKIEEVIRSAVPNPSVTSDNLIQSALEGGGEDNVSVIVIQIIGDVNPKALPRVEIIAKPDSVHMPQF